MSFDVYVGTFTRYISGEWENEGQTSAREMGVPYALVRADETEEAPPPTEDIRISVNEWIEGMNQGLSKHLKKPLRWPETEEAPYFTERPGWAAYASLMLLAAYDDAEDLARPRTLPEEWGEDAAYVRAIREGSETRYPALLIADLWLPGDFEFMFGIEDLGGNPRKIASTEALCEELQELNLRTFKAAPEELAMWRDVFPDESGNLEDLAKHAFAHLMGLAEKAVENKLPMMLDY